MKKVFTTMAALAIMTVTAMPAMAGDTVEGSGTTCNVNLTIDKYAALSGVPTEIPVIVTGGATSSEIAYVGYVVNCNTACTVTGSVTENSLGTDGTWSVSGNIDTFSAGIDQSETVGVQITGIDMEDVAGSYAIDTVVTLDLAINNTAG